MPSRETFEEALRRFEAYRAGNEFAMQEDDLGYVGQAARRYLDSLPEEREEVVYAEYTAAGNFVMFYGTDYDAAVRYAHTKDGHQVVKFRGTVLVSK